MTVLASAVLLVTGLHGVVTRGPTAPVCKVGSPCSAPAVGAVLVFSRNGVVAARVRVGAGGLYSVKLEPGLYAVEQQVAPKVGAGIRPRQVLVRRGVLARVNFLIDTGIR